MTSRKKQYENLFTGLNKYMFSSENIIRYTDINSKIKLKDKTVHKKQNTQNEKSNVFIPYQKDMLFWCFYIILNDKEKYLFNINNIFSIEKETKIKAIEILKTKKDILKEKKLKKTEIENELLNDKIITLKGLSGLCIAYNISLCVVKNRTVYNLNNNECVHGIIYWENNKYGVYDVADINTYYKKILDEYYVANPSKPIKSVSGYTVKDLQDICKKLNISIIDNNGMKLKKNDIYDKIQTIL